MATVEKIKKPSEAEFLKKFYAVTLRSVYLARIGKENDEDKDAVPALKKITASKDGLGYPAGNEISNGTMLAVRECLQLFVPEGSGWLSPTSTVEREITRVNTRFHGGHTSPIVALFLMEREAMDCFDYSDLRARDPRWKRQTIEVLRTIGAEHPFCAISSSDSAWWLYPPEEWMRA